MSVLRLPILGPIVGHTTHNSCRIWVRGSAPRDRNGVFNSSLRTVGVIALVNNKGKVIKENGMPVAYYFRLHREFDRTGVFNIGKDVALGGHEVDKISRKKQSHAYQLKPDTVYYVRVAILVVDDPEIDDKNLDDTLLSYRLPPISKVAFDLETLDPAHCEAVFKTFPSEDLIADSISFLICSCRYPGLFGATKSADKIYEPMIEHVVNKKNSNSAKFTLMMGDQIYADIIHRNIPWKRADSYEEFRDRYHEAFGASQMRRLLRNSTTYMILDDHEIENNWSRDRLQEKDRLFCYAIGSYMNYQWSHSPRNYGRKLFYDFNCGGYPFFVLDTRTQRIKSNADGLRDNHMLGRPALHPSYPGQLDLLLNWLVEKQNKHGNIPKFIVASSVFVPNPIDERIEMPRGLDKKIGNNDMLYEVNRYRRERSDSWPAFPNTRLSIMECIVNYNIQNVVFLTGDIHCACVAKMRFEKGNEDIGIMAYNITSSPLYWPFLFANGDPNDFVHDSAAEEQYDGFPLGDSGVTMHYEAWGFYQEDNFCRVEIDKKVHKLFVQVFNHNGVAVEVSVGGKSTTRNFLPLNPW